MANELFVGVGDMRVSNDPSAILITYSLGSCIGISIYDPMAKVGGMLHFMLPEPGKTKKDQNKAKKNPYVYASTGVPLLLKEACEYGADKERLVIKIAGGAKMTGVCKSFNIGRQNYEALCKILRENGLRIHKKDIGGHVSRGMRLEIETGRVYVKSLDGKMTEL